MRELYKTCGNKTRYFICRVNKMVNYLDKFLPFGARQHPLEDEILELGESSLPKEWQKELIIQGFDSATQVLTELVEFFECLETAEEIFQT